MKKSIFILVQTENKFIFVEKPLVDSLKESNAHHKTLTDDSIPDKENREKHQKSESPCSKSQTPYDIASFQLNSEWLMRLFKQIREHTKIYRYNKFE